MFLVANFIVSDCPRNNGSSPNSRTPDSQCCTKLSTACASISYVVQVPPCLVTHVAHSLAENQPSTKHHSLLERVQPGAREREKQNTVQVSITPVFDIHGCDNLAHQLTESNLAHGTFFFFFPSHATRGPNEYRYWKLRRNPHKITVPLGKKEGREEIWRPTKTMVRSPNEKYQMGIVEPCKERGKQKTLLIEYRHFPCSMADVGEWHHSTVSTYTHPENIMII